MNEILWYQLPDEAPAERDLRLSKELHRIFFEGKACNEICPEYLEPTHDIICRICGAEAMHYRDLVHNTPPFMESLDAMQLIVESGRFAEVREEYFHWLDSDRRHECRIIGYHRVGDPAAYFHEKGSTRQEAFYLAALRSMYCTVIKEEQGKQ